MNKYYCMQTDENDCGFACIKMMMANEFKDERYLFLIKDYKHKEYSVRELEDIAKENNLDCRGVFFDDINELYKLRKLIIQINMDGKKHFTYFIKGKKERIYLSDPKLGNIILSKTEFEKMFTGYGLIYEGKKENILKEDRSYHFNNFPLIFIFFSYFLDILLIYIGTYFIKPDTEIIINIMLILCFAFNTLSKIFFYHLFMSKVDKEEIIPLLEKMKEKGIRENVYSLFLEYKNGGITYYSSFIGNVIIIFFVCFICLIQTLYFLPLILLIIIYISLFSYLTNNRNKILMVNMTKLESELLINPDSNNYRKVVSYTDRFMKGKIAFRIILFILIAVSLIIVSYFAKIQSFTFFVFYFFVFEYLGEKTDMVIHYKNKKYELDMLTNRMNSLKKYISEYEKNKIQ